MIRLNADRLPLDVRDCIEELVNGHLGVECHEEGTILKVVQTDDFEVRSTGNEIVIKYSERVQIYRGLGLALEKLRTQESFNYTYHSAFNSIGPMIDMSQNGVMTLEAMKKMVRMIALMGMNRCYLYMEDVYPIEANPLFGYMRGAYSKEELMSLDHYAWRFGIEMIPVIQTLGHLKTALRWRYTDPVKDTDEILLVGEEATYDFVDKQIEAISACFLSNKIHLGMDESTRLGLGKSLEKYGYRERKVMMLQHLNKVVALTEKHRLKPMIWSDMFFRLCSPVHEYYDVDAEVTSDIIESIPDALTLVYWDYYHHDSTHYDHMISKHQQLTDNMMFAGGIWTWNSGVTNYRKTFDTLNAGLGACKNGGIKDIMITIWGDDGTECNYFSALLGLQLAAEHNYSEMPDIDAMRRRFMTCTGGDYDLFMMMEAFDNTPGTDYEGGKNPVYNPSKYVLWQDILIGLFDRNIDKVPLARHYTKLYESYLAIESSDDWMQLHNHYTILAKCLSIKADLGIALKTAYDNADRRSMQKILNEQMTELLRYVDKLHASHQKLWFDTYKAFGWEVMDLRYGGLKQRIISAAKRVGAYLNEELERIEELEYERHPYDGGFVFNDQWMLTENKYHNIVTAGQYIHNPGG